MKQSIVRFWCSTDAVLNLKLCVLFLFPSLLFCQINAINFTVQDGLPSPEAYSVHEDADGYIWICTDRGLSRYNGYEFENFSTKDGLSYNTVFDIYEDEHHNFWITAFDGSLTIYDYGEKKLKPFFLNSELKKLSSSSLLSGIGINKESVDIFKQLGSDTVEIYTYSFKDTSIIKKEIKIDKPVHYQNLSLQLGIDLITEDTIPGFVQFFTDQNNIESYSPDYLMDTKSVKVYDNEVLMFDNKGLIIINDKGKHHYNFENVSSFIKDRDGNYWVSSLTSGVHLIPSFDFLFIEKDKIIGPKLGDKLNTIIGIDEDILIGTKQGRVLQLNTDMQSCKEVAKIDRVISNFYKVNNKIFTNWGFEFINPNHKIVVHPEFMEFEGFAPYQDGLVGYGMGNSIVLFDDDGNQYLKLHRDEVVESSRTISVCAVPSGEIYFSTFRDLYKMTTDYNIHNISEEYDLKNIAIRKITTTNDSILLFASSGDGLIIKSLNTITKISKKDGLSSDFVNDILCIDNVIWCATNFGISRIQYEQNKGVFQVKDISNYTTTEGLGANYIIKIIENEGRIWALSNIGVVSFDKDIKIFRNKSPNVKIKSLKQANAMYNNGQVFRHNQNRIEINYLAISTKKNTSGKFYRYKMLKDNNEASWEFTDNRSVAYDELGKGNYKFLICCKVENGEWSIPSQIGFEILPHFLDHFWVRCLAIFILFSIIYLLYRIDVNRRKKRYMETLELATATNKLNKLELEVLRGQMNPHFIYNALNSVQKFLLKEDKVGANNFISRLAKMLRSGLEYTRYESISLEEEIDFLDNYLKIETQRFPERFSYAIEVENNMDVEDIQIPPLLLQPLCENAIKHAYQGQKVSIKISIEEYTDELLKVYISDNGSGYLNTIDNLDRSKSLGIAILYKRLKIFLDKGFEVSCGFKYLDDKNKTGTIVELVIPIIE